MKKFKSSYEVLTERLIKENKITIISAKESIKITKAINQEIQNMLKKT